MKFANLTGALIASLCLAPACALDEADSSTETQASEMDMGDGGHGGHNCPGASPIMLSGDFDGDGTVTSADIAMLEAYKDAGDYAAFFDMNVDGKLDGRDVSAVAQNMGQAAAARDAQMAQLWATTEPYRNIGNAYAAGYVPFTPDLKGHGIHFANFDLIYSWQARGGFNAGQPEGLNYTATGELVAAFYYAPAAVDLADFGYPFPDNMFYQHLEVPHHTFHGLDHHEWHSHVGPCFGGATSPVPGFDQCMTEHECMMVGGQLWSPKFHMLHVWLFELNHCGPFGGVDHDISQSAPDEPNHGACDIQDVVHCVVIGSHPDGTPMCLESDGGGGHDGH